MQAVQSYHCTNAQQRAVMATTPASKRGVALIEACDFKPSCLRRNATGRLRQLLSFSKSQSVEDLHAYLQFFDAPGYNATRQARGGVYVELGALDGVAFSNSLFFQQKLGWSGVLIEAALHNFLLLSKNIAHGVRRNVSAVHAAACPSPTMLQIPLPVGYYDAGSDVLNSRKMRGASGRATNSTATSMLYTFKSKGTATLDLAPVLCVPMRTLLEGAPHTAHARGIELFSIDVEGHELNVVASHDWRRLPAKVVIVEMNKRTNSPANQAQIRGVLRESGGLCFFGWSGHGNEVWVDPEYEHKIA